MVKYEVEISVDARWLKLLAAMTKTGRETNIRLWCQQRGIKYKASVLNGAFQAAKEAKKVDQKEKVQEAKPQGTPTPQAS